MGLFSKKTTSKTTMDQNTSMNTMPVNPGFVTSGIEGLSNKINSTFAGLDPSQMVAGANPLQTLAGTNAGRLTDQSAFQTGQTFLGRAGDAGAQNVESVNLGDYIPQFMNPYLKDVVDTSLTDFDEGAGMTRAQNRLALAGDTTFGGSGGSIQTALSERGLAQDRGRLAADLRSGGFDRASQLAVQQAGNDLQTRMANANFGEAANNRLIGAGSALTTLGSARGDNLRQNAVTQAGIGAGLRDILNEQLQSPIQTLMQQIAAFGGLPLDLLKGSTSTGTMSGTSTTKGKSSGASLSDWLSAAGNAAAAAAVASDGRLKQDVVEVGRDARGHRWVEYAYVWDPETRHRGVIAQEAREITPEAVIEGPSGLLFVDYSKLGGA